MKKVNSATPEAKLAEQNQAVIDADANLNKSPEELQLEELRQKADDTKAQVAETSPARTETAALLSGEPTTAVDAGVLRVDEGDGSVLAGDHKAQKFGNDPENPKPAPGLNPAVATIRLYRQNPDGNGPATCDCHPEMKGDYLRAGWTDIPPVDPMA